MILMTLEVMLKGNRKHVQSPSWNSGTPEKGFLQVCAEQKMGEFLKIYLLFEPADHQFLHTT